MQHHLIFHVWAAALVGTLLGLASPPWCQINFLFGSCAFLGLHVAVRLRARSAHYVLLLAAVCLFWAARASRPQVMVAKHRSQALLIGRVVGPVKRAQDDEGLFTQKARLALCVRPPSLEGPQTEKFIRLRLGPSPKVRSGDVLAVTADLEPPPPALSMSDPTPLIWARRQGVIGQARKVRPHIVLLRGTGLFAVLDHLRQQAAASLHDLLPSSTASLVRTLALGDAAGLTSELRDSFAQTGTAHLLAVSGLHIGLVMGLSTTLVYAGGVWVLRRSRPGTLPPRRVWAAWAASPFWVGYGLLAGGSPAPDRALVMLIAATFAKTFYQKIDPLTLLSASGIVVLGSCPEQRLSLGYGLSFSAVLGLLVAPKGKTVRRRSRKTSHALILQGIGRLFWVSCIATWYTLPVLLYVLGQISVVGPLFNLIALPLGATVATPLALVSCFGALGLGGTEGMGHRSLLLLMRATEICFTFWERLTQSVAALVPLYWQVVPGNTVWLFLWLGFTALAAAFFGQRLEGQIYRDAKRWRFFALLMLGMALCFFLFTSSATPPGAWVISHLYVGQGDATLVRFPDGQHWLIDGGGPLYPGAPDTEGHRLKGALLRAGVHKLDVVVLTHPHPDHFGGLVALARTMPIEKLWLGDDDPLPKPVRELISHVRRLGGTAERPPKKGQVGGVDFRFYRPLANVSATPNDHSLVLHLRLGERTALLCGDIEGRAETALLGQPLSAELMKVAHHGSRTSSSSAFLRAVAPRFAIISTGRNNSFHFPHQEAVDRIAGAQSEVISLAERGDALFWTRGEPWHRRFINSGPSSCGSLLHASVDGEIEELCDALRARLSARPPRQIPYLTQIDFRDGIAHFPHFFGVDAKSAKTKT